MKASDPTRDKSISHRAALIAVCLDHEGQDEWYVCAFDENGDHSDNLLASPDGGINGEFHGTFRECAMKASDFAAKNPELQLRVVIGRVC